MDCSYTRAISADGILVGQVSIIVINFLMNVFLIFLWLFLCIMRTCKECLPFILYSPFSPNKNQDQMVPPSLSVSVKLVRYSVLC